MQARRRPLSTHALENMKRAGAASAIPERHTPPRSWEGVGQSPPLTTSAAVRCSANFFTNDQPTASLAVWAYMIPSEAMKHDVYSNTTAGCSSMIAPTVRWLPARAITMSTEGSRVRSKDYTALHHWFLILRPTLGGFHSMQAIRALHFLATINSPVSRWFVVTVPRPLLVDTSSTCCTRLLISPRTSTLWGITTSSS